MTYTPTTWHDLPNTSTPISAANLNNIEAGIVAAYVQGVGGLLNADIGAGAGIAYSKLALANSVVNADVATGAAIAYTKLNLTGGVVNNDISGSAAIVASKLASYPSDGTKVLYGDGTWKVPAGAGAELTYDEFSANVTISATTPGAANTIVTATAHTYDGAAIFLTFYAPLIEPGATAASAVELVVYMDGAQIGGGTMWYAQKDSSATIDDGVTGCMFSFRTTPAAGSHTYSVRGFRAVSNGQVSAGSGFANGFIRTTKV